MKSTMSFCTTFTTKKLYLISSHRTLLFLLLKLNFQVAFDVELGNESTLCHQHHELHANRLSVYCYNHYCQSTTFFYQQHVKTHTPHLHSPGGQLQESQLQVEVPQPDMISDWRLFLVRKRDFVREWLMWKVRLEFCWLLNKRDKLAKWIARRLLYPVDNPRWIQSPDAPRVHASNPIAISPQHPAYIPHMRCGDTGRAKCNQHVP